MILKCHCRGDIRLFYIFYRIEKKSCLVSCNLKPDPWPYIPIVVISFELVAHFSKKHQLRFCLFFIFLYSFKKERNSIRIECVCVLHERCVYFAHLIEITVMLHPSTLSEHMCCDRKQHSNANVSFFLCCPFFSFLSFISCNTVCAETATDNRYPRLLLAERY